MKKFLVILGLLQLVYNNFELVLKRKEDPPSIDTSEKIAIKDL